MVVESSKLAEPWFEIMSCNLKCGLRLSFYTQLQFFEVALFSVYSYTIKPVASFGQAFRRQSHSKITVFRLVPEVFPRTIKNITVSTAVPIMLWDKATTLRAANIIRARLTRCNWLCITDSLLCGVEFPSTSPAVPPQFSKSRWPHKFYSAR